MRKEIFITNDDSIDSKGLHAIAEFFRQYGNVMVIAPKFPQSAKSAALSLESLLRLTPMGSEDAREQLGAITYYALDGTPADCSKMAMNMYIEAGRRPALLVSGINHGSNASAAAIYSGTLGAAKEGAIYGITSIGVSIDSHDQEADLSGVLHFMPQIVENVLSCPPAEGTLLNINFPALPPDKIKGIRFARQGRGRWMKEFVQQTDPRGREFYWMVGQFLNMETEPENNNADHLLMEDGYVTIVPMKIDNTDYEELERLEKEWKITDLQTGN